MSIAVFIAQHSSEPKVEASTVFCLFEYHIIGALLTKRNTPITSMAQLAELQAVCREVYVDPSLIQYAVKLVSATRRPERFGLTSLSRHLSHGASPRATIGLIEGARALALMRGRHYALPEDITPLVGDVLRHRLVLSYEALSEGITVDQVIAKVQKSIPLPDGVTPPV